MTTTTRIYSVPEHTLAGLGRYVERRGPPGDFLRAVLSNDLYMAVRLADDENLRALPEIVRHVLSTVPYRGRGSPEKVRAWLTKEEA